METFRTPNFTKREPLLGVGYGLTEGPDVPRWSETYQGGLSDVRGQGGLRGAKVIWGTNYHVW